MLCDKRPALLIHKVVVLIIRIEAFELKLFSISYPVVSITIGMPVGMAIRQAVRARRLGIRFGVLAPRGYGVEVDKHVNDCTQVS